MDNLSDKRILVLAVALDACDRTALGAFFHQWGPFEHGMSMAGDVMGGDIMRG
ncbi:hypothetical protein ACL2XO_13775 [Sodalis sp. RH15]|uniref:hypothetical protein n=1 Tax=Sodalis sp. RH15 TaxID=3394330 RepID=UPI0039B6AB8E